ncbi:MAG: hypothetical protein GC184_06080 [Rhizobiales bacterium]|nr:hypothetical protein [Hyphomicrobiales bacterium]
MAKTNKLISCYGTDEDRIRATLVAKRAGKSISKLLLDHVRSEYEKVYGAADPHDVIETGE